MRFEAWTLPWSTTFERVIADIPVIEDTGRGTLKFSDFGEGSIAVPASYPRLDEIISSTGGSLIRVYEGSSLVHEWVAERTQQAVDNTVINISGTDLLGYSFDRAVVYPYDYPTNPTTQPDWTWGGGNILGNPGFEDSTVTSTVYELTITATGGTYTLSDGTDTTSAIAYNAAAGTIATRIQTDLGLFTDVVVSPAGTSPLKFVITMVTPAYGVNLTINTGSLTGGTGSVAKTTTGGLSPGSWTIAKTLGSAGGAYTTFTVTDVRAHTGTYSLEVNPAASSLTSNRWPGAQQIINVTPGLYQASVWVYPTSGSDTFQLQIRGIGEELIAYSTNGALTVNNWNQITISDIEIPAGTTQVIFRLYCTNPGPSDPSSFFIDDAEFYGGLAAATIGKIAIDLLDDATTDHSADTRGTVLDWVDYTGFSATTDSNAANWDETLSFTVQRGMTYGQWLETVRTLGYEFRLVAKATPGATTHNLELYNPDGMDAAPDVGLITGGSIVDGSVSKRIPNYTATLLEGASGVYDEGVDATNQTNFGRLEKYLSNNQWGDTTTIGLAEAELFAAEASNLQAIKAELAGGNITPLVDFVPGDTVSFQLPGLVVKNTRRVQQVSYRNATATVYEVVGSKVFAGQSGVYELVRRLWRRFLRVPEQQVIPAVVTSGGGTPTYTIAKIDSTPESQAKADFVLPTTTSDLTGLVNSLETQSLGISGEIVICEAETPYKVNVESCGGGIECSFHIRGLGTGVQLEAVGSAGIAVSCLSIEKITVNSSVAGMINVSAGHIEGCTLGSSGSGSRNANVTVSGRITGCYLDNLVYGDNNSFVASGNVWHGNSTRWIELSTGTGLVHGVVITGNVFQGQATSSSTKLVLSNVDEGVVVGNVIVGTGGTTTVSVTGSNRVNFTGNAVIASDGGHTFYVDGSDDILFSSNTIRRTEMDTDNTYDVFHFRGTSLRGHVVSNQFFTDGTLTDESRYGVFADTGSTAIVVGNQFDSEWGTGEFGGGGTITTAYAGGGLGNNFSL